MFSRREPYTFYLRLKKRKRFASGNFFYNTKNCQRASSSQWKIFLCPLIDWHRISFYIDILCWFETCVLYRILPLTITWFTIYTNCKIAETIGMLWLLLKYQCSSNSVSWVIYVRQKAAPFKVPNLVKTINLRKFWLSNSVGYRVEMTRTEENKDNSSSLFN